MNLAQIHKILDGTRNIISVVVEDNTNSTDRRYSNETDLDYFLTNTLPEESDVDPKSIIIKEVYISSGTWLSKAYKQVVSSLQ